MSFVTVNRTHQRIINPTPDKNISMGADFFACKGANGKPSPKRGVLAIHVGRDILDKAKFKPQDRIKLDIDPEAGRVRLTLSPTGWTLSGAKTQKKASIRVTLHPDLEELLPPAYRNIIAPLIPEIVEDSSISVGPGVLEFTIPQYPVGEPLKPWE